jgi:RNA polymerase sigma-70 factor (ECF subfamily)
VADLTDEELMVMFQQGNAAAFERLFERYRLPLFNFLLRLLHFQRESAEDVLQEVFIKLAKARELYEPRSPFRPWVYTIARNHGLNHLRSRAVASAQKNISFDELTDPTSDRPGRELAGKDDTYKTIASKDEVGRLDRIIDRLPSPAKEVFLLHAVEGLSPRDCESIGAESGDGSNSFSPGASPIVPDIGPTNDLKENNHEL